MSLAIVCDSIYWARCFANHMDANMAFDFLIAVWLMDILGANDPIRNSLDWEIHPDVSAIPSGLQFRYQSWDLGIALQSHSASNRQ